MSKTKVVDLDDFYNFVVDDLFIWNHLVPQNSIRSSQILKFKFWIIKKLIWRNDHNFFVDNFSIWNHLLFQNFIWSSYILKFKFWIVHTISKEEITKTKVVDLDEI